MRLYRLEKFLEIIVGTESLVQIKLRFHERISVQRARYKPSSIFIEKRLTCQEGVFGIPDCIVLVAIQLLCADLRVCTDQLTETAPELFWVKGPQQRAILTQKEVRALTSWETNST